MQSNAEIYLDNNATTQVLPEIRDAVLEAMGECFGNPSSVHLAGERGRQHLRRARESLAALLGCDPSQIVFMSSGTEANNLILASAAIRRPGRARIVTAGVEHSSILKFCEFLETLGAEIVLVSTDRLGHLDLDELFRAITPDTTLVSIQWVNNETGVIQPIERIGETCRSLGVPFHTDAAQAVGKLKMSVSQMPVDYLSLTGHKFHGPQGIGALYAVQRRALTPLLWGGSQEHGVRAGTENVPGIVGIGKAAELRLNRLAEIHNKLALLRDQFERSIQASVAGVRINGNTASRICNTSNLLFSEVDGQALVARLDQENIRCSQSSACTNLRPEPSYVLRAMGLTEEEAYSSVRFSFAENNSLEEVSVAARKIAEICAQLRQFGSRRHFGKPMIQVD